MTLKKVLFLSLTVLLVLSVSGLFVKNRVQTRVNDLFRMNKTLQQEGYYMAEFEFKMMGIVYYLDKGRYAKALSSLTRFHSQLKNRKNLIKVPEFKDTEDEMNFYLTLQNPVTGAFMDDSFPYCTFNEPTENIINHLDELAKKMGVPLHLKYPLTYLDQINTPEKLQDFLDDVAYVGWIGSRLPETTFVFARSLLSQWNDEGVIGKNNLYRFSDAYKAALLGWFYAHQDSATGYWGPMSRRTGRIIKLDLNNTASIIKAFVDRNGENIHDPFPLRYKDKIFATTLEILQRPLPEEGELDQWHAWNLSMSKGLKMLLRYLWKDASDDERQKAGNILETYVKIKFEKYFIPNQGAFSFYPDAEHASLDGTGGFIFKDIGAYSSEIQEKLWGAPETNIKGLGQFKTSGLTQKDWEFIKSKPGINSFRLYDTKPDYKNLTAHVAALVYPEKTPVLDVMELVPGINAWLDTVKFSIGNWTSREQIKNGYTALKIKEPLISKEVFPFDLINQRLQRKKELHVIGFDLLQIPRCEIVYLYSPEN